MNAIFVLKAWWRTS
ncbi:trp operon leader peptide [Shigella dysenteriae]|nr:trp operon leader peptide [Shigella dysenteriae]RIE80947.1 trp operon leader peptide [Shigella dysenteriae]